MANKEYIERLQMVIEHLHGCRATWLQAVPVTETFNGETAWQGDVHVYALTGHPKAQRCYGWSHGEPEEFITILELPPVTDADSAVKVGVAYQVRRANQK